MTQVNSSKAVHPSYRLHRRQVWTHILLPVLLATIAMLGVIALICVSTFGGNGDVGRWAAISTMWLVVPAMVAEVAVLAALVALIYLLSRLIGIIPPYSSRAQKIVHRIESTVRRGADMVRRPSSGVRALARYIRDRLVKGPERM